MRKGHTVDGGKGAMRERGSARANGEDSSHAIRTVWVNESSRPPRRVSCVSDAHKSQTISGPINFRRFRS